MKTKTKTNDSNLVNNEELIIISSNMLPPALKEIGIDSVLLDKSAYVNGLFQEDIDKIKAAVASLVSL